MSNGDGGFFNAFNFGAGLEEAYPGSSEANVDQFQFPSFNFDVPTFAQGAFDHLDSFQMPGADRYLSPGGGQPTPFSEGYHYDTSADEIVDPSGQRTPTADILREGPEGPGREGALLQAPSGAGVGPGEQPPPGFNLERFLGTNVGRGALALGLGAAGMGLGRAVAGGTPNLRIPPPQQSAITQATEGPLAELYRRRALEQAAAEAAQSPAEAAIRAQALGLLPGMIQPNAVTPFEDPIQAALTAQLLPMLRGETSASPQTLRRQQEENQIERQRLFRQLGPDYELSTAGQDALNRLRQRHTEEQFSEREGLLASRLGPQQSRQQFAYQAPIQNTQGLEAIRRGALGDTGQLANFGFRGLPGTGGSEATAQLGSQFAAQQALSRYGTETQNQRELAAGIGGLFGNVASAATRPRLEDLLKTYGLAMPTYAPYGATT